MKPNKIRSDADLPEAVFTGRDPMLGPLKRFRGPAGMIGRYWYGSSAEDPDGEMVMSPERRRAMLILSLVLSLTTLLVIGGVMIVWMRSRGLVGSDAPKAQKERIVSRFVSPSEDQALDLVKRALATRDPAKVPELFRPGSASASEVIAFLEESSIRDGTFERLEWRGSMDVQDQLMEGVTVKFVGKPAFEGRLAFLVPDDKGVWKVDFEGLARTSHPRWQDLLEQRSDHARVRLFVCKGTYYNGPFLDERQWECFGMVSLEAKEQLPEGQELWHGYCKDGSPQAKAMKRIFASGQRTMRVTLEIRRMPGANTRQFEISRVLAEDWVLTDKPFDERFN